jgi:hypothetical protein
VEREGMMARGNVTFVNEEERTRTFENRCIKSEVSKGLNVIKSSPAISFVDTEYNSGALENVSMSA